MLQESSWRRNRSPYDANAIGPDESGEPANENERPWPDMNLMGKRRWMMQENLFNFSHLNQSDETR